jgi:hypothetical protein
VLTPTCWYNPLIAVREICRCVAVDLILRSAVKSSEGKLLALRISFGHTDESRIQERLQFLANFLERLAGPRSAVVAVLRR